MPADPDAIHSVSATEVLAMSEARTTTMNQESIRDVGGPNVFVRSLRPGSTARGVVVRPSTASLRQVMGAVAWGFLGVRKCKAMARDIRTIKPAQLIVVAIVFAAIFVFTLLLIVRLITHGV